jgi:hypothetical protein
MFEALQEAGLPLYAKTTFTNHIAHATNSISQLRAYKIGGHVYTEAIMRNLQLIHEFFYQLGHSCAAIVWKVEAEQEIFEERLASFDNNYLSDLVKELVKTAEGLWENTDRHISLYAISKLAPQIEKIIDEFDKSLQIQE